MVLVIVGAILTAVLLVLQGVHVFRHGDMRPFFDERNRHRPANALLTPHARLTAGVFYVAAGTAVLSLLLIALWRTGFRLLQWLANHFIPLGFGVFFLVYGLVGALRPRVIIRSVRAAYAVSDFDRDDSVARNLVRVICVGLIAASLLILAAM